jgi:hypothetical protein
MTSQFNPPPRSVTAVEIENGAIAIATVAGILWGQAEPEQRQLFRLYANAVLMRLALGPAVDRLAALQAEVRSAAHTLRRAVNDEFEGVNIAGLAKVATTLELLDSVLSDPADDEPI